MKTALFIIFLLLLSLSGQAKNQNSDRANSKAEAAASPSFKKFLLSVVNNHPRWISEKMKLQAEKSAQWPRLLSATPEATLTATSPIHKWSGTGSESSRLLLNLNLFRGGGDFFAYKSGQKALDQSDLKLNLAAIHLQETAAKILFDWLELKLNLQSRKNLLESKKELLRVARERYARGQLPEQEVDKVKVELSNAEIEIRQAEVELLSIKADLDSYLAGATEIQDWPWQEATKNNIFSKLKPVAERFQSNVYELEKELRMNKSREALSNWIPRVDLSSRFDSDHLTPNSDGAWSSYVTFTFQLWDRGQNISDRRYWSELSVAADADLRSYQLTEEAKLTSLRDRFDKTFQNAQQSLASLNESQKIAKESLRRFQLGRASVNDLSIDQARLNSTETLAASAIKQLHLVLLEICVSADELPSNCYNL